MAVALGEVLDQALADLGLRVSWVRTLLAESFFEVVVLGNLVAFFIFELE